MESNYPVALPENSRIPICDIEQWLHMYEQMLKIRLFEEQVNELYKSAKMPGLGHLYLGEEAIAVGVCETLRKDDYITSTHRGHGHCLAKGVRRASETDRWVYLASLRSLTRWNVESRLREIRAPVLVLGAEFDLTTSAEKKRWVARMPRARFVEIPGTRHHSEQDAPERFNREVLGFLRGQVID